MVFGNTPWLLHGGPELEWKQHGSTVQDINESGAESVVCLQLTETIYVAQWISRVQRYTEAFEEPLAADGPPRHVLLRKHKNSLATIRQCWRSAICLQKVTSSHPSLVISQNFATVGRVPLIAIIPPSTQIVLKLLRLCFTCCGICPITMPPLLGSFTRRISKRKDH